MTVGAAPAATTRSPIGASREVLGFIVNIRFKICRPGMMRAAVDVFWVISAERLGNGAAISVAAREFERIGAYAIQTERRGAPGQPVGCEDRKRLHCRPIP